MKCAVSVAGLIPADQIGRTLPHEHLFSSMTYAFPAQNESAHRPITIDNLGGNPHRPDVKRKQHHA